MHFFPEISSGISWEKVYKSHIHKFTEYSELVSFFLISDALNWGFYCQNQKKFLLITVPEAETSGNTIYINKDFVNLILILNNCRCPTHPYLCYMFVLNSVVRICLDI